MADKRRGNSFHSVLIKVAAMWNCELELVEFPPKMLT